MSTISEHDLEHVLSATESLWPTVKGAAIFVTGATGFFGCWLMETFVAANRRLDLGAKMIVLSRDPARFAERNPALAQCPELVWVQGDIRTLSTTELVERAGVQNTRAIPWMVHLVTEADLTTAANRPVDALTTIVETTRRGLELARDLGVQRFLFPSSGAVYGPQLPTCERVSEDCFSGPDYLNPEAAYALGGEAKRYAEALSVAFGRQHAFDVVIARGFSFVGPYLPLESKFAIGNFMRDALVGKPIVIHGDGTPIRSYLYGADLAIWLWTMLAKGRGGRAYNLGSDQAMSLERIARMVDERGEARAGLHIAQQATPGVPSQRYVPSTERATTELGLTVGIGLGDAIERTMRWHRSRR